MNFFIKSATKHQLAYRYGARKENLTFFQHYSLNQDFHSLYGVKEEKSFEVFYEKRKILYSQLNNSWFPFPVWSKENISFHSWQ